MRQKNRTGVLLIFIGEILLVLAAFAKLAKINILGFLSYFSAFGLLGAALGFVGLIILRNANNDCKSAFNTQIGVLICYFIALIFTMIGSIGNGMPWAIIVGDSFSIVGDVFSIFITLFVIAGVGNLVYGSSTFALSRQAIYFYVVAILLACICRILLFITRILIGPLEIILACFAAACSILAYVLYIVVLGKAYNELK